MLKRAPFLASALFSVACSSGGSEPATPESSASAPARATASATATATAPTLALSSSAVVVSETSKPAEPGVDLRVVPMKIALGAAGTVEVKADGTVWVTAKGKTVQGAKVDKNMLVSTDNSGSLAVLKDGTIAMTPPKGSAKLSFDDKDAVVASSGARISIDDKGTVDMVKDDGTHEKAPPKITGFKPEARRLAGLVILMTEMPPNTAGTESPKAGACEAVGGKCVSAAVDVACASEPPNKCGAGEICCVMAKGH